MNSIFFVGFAIAAAFIATLLKRMEPNIAAFVSLSACVMILLGVGEQLGNIVNSMRAITQSAQIDDAYIGLLLRIVGIAYVAQIGAQACRDAGSANIAEHVELCAKVVILSISTPVFLSLVEMITGVLQ